MRDNETARNDADLWYTTAGTGPPMLVMHGGMGWDHSYFRPALDMLGSAVELIYYDHRGNGRSPQPADWSTVTNATWVEDAERLRIRLGHERVLILGHSYGGALAQEYALRYPDRVAGLILCATYPVFDHVDVVLANARARATSAQFDALLAAMSQPVSDDATFGTTFRQLLPMYFHRPSSELIGAMDSVRFRAAAFNRAFFHSLPGFSTLGELDHIAAPTLVLAGDDDWIAPVEPCATRLQAGIAGSELVVIPESGHFPFLERPVEFAAAVRSWLERTGLVVSGGQANPH